MFETNLVLSFLFVVLSGLVILLFFLISRLLKRIQEQQQSIERSSETLRLVEADISALIASASGVDSKLFDLNRRLTEAESVEKSSEPRETEAGFHSAIRNAQNGADVHQLVRENNLPLEEAELIVRLYGGQSAEESDSEPPISL